MQSSISMKIPRIVSLRSRLRAKSMMNKTTQTIHRRPLSCVGQQKHPHLVLQPECDNSHPSSSLNNHHAFRMCSVEQQQQTSRIHSTLASTSFWRGLHQAVRTGNGSMAEEIAEQVLQDYYRLTMAASESQPSEAAVDQDSYFSYDEHSSAAIVRDSEDGNLPPLLDSQIFSLVLQAWKNSDDASLNSALRAHNLLIQMAALVDQDVLCDPPALEDYLAVLECWQHATSRNEDGNESSSSSSEKTRRKRNQNGSIVLVLQHAEELWEQMKERQRREMMTNQIPHFEIDERAYDMFASLLAKAGKASQVEQLVREAVEQQLGRNVRKYNFLASPATDRNAGDTAIDDDNKIIDECDPKVSLSLCNTVLEAHLQSKETKASERAEAFLQRMRSDHNLPNPDVSTYNLLLERWMLSSKQSRSIDAMTKIANRVEELIHQMKDEDRIQPNLVSYQYCIDALARSGDPIRAETMLANLVKDYFLQYDADVKPTIAPFQSVLWAYSKAATQGPAHRRLADASERAESILKNMKELSSLLDTHPTVWSYNIVMKCWAHSKSPDAAARAMALYEDLAQQPSKREDEASRGEQSTDMKHQTVYGADITRPIDLKPDATSMNTVLNTLSIREGAVRTEQKLLEFCHAHVREPHRNPCPDKIAFSTVINAWSNSSSPNAPDRADKLLRKLMELYSSEKKKMHKPDIVTYTNVMQCWIKSRRTEAPEKVDGILRELQRMEREGDATMKPDAACWNSVISAWAAAGNGERAEALFLEMVDNSTASGGASPTSITLTNVLKAWTNTKSPEACHRAIALLAKMEKLYKDGIVAVKPNVVNYSVVLDCLAYARTSSAAERAEGILEQMMKSDDPNLHPNVVSYNCVIKAWSYARDPRSPTKITSTLRDLIDQSQKNHKMRPNENTFGTILKFFADSDLPDKAKRARAIENLMTIFLEREPKQWIKTELQRCLSSTEFNSSPSTVSTTSESLDQRSVCIEEKIGSDASTAAQIQSNNDEDTNTSTGSCRGKRANNRFNNEIKLRNLIRKPITGEPNASSLFETDANVRDECEIRDALVRVRLIGEGTVDESKHKTLRKSDKSNQHELTLVVVDGESEYTCNVIDLDGNLTSEIKGGQFLNISYYWCRGEPVIVKIQDAVEGSKILG